MREQTKADTLAIRAQARWQSGWSPVRPIGVRFSSPGAALKPLEACRGHGCHVTVAVVDRSGAPQVVLRNRCAGAQTVKSAIEKAWTSISFRQGTPTGDQCARGRLAAIRDDIDF